MNAESDLLEERVDLLCLDAGNTTIFLDHARLATALVPFGVDVTEGDVIVAEGRAKVLADQGALVDVPWSFRDRPGAVGWGKMVAAIAAQAGLRERDLAPMLDVIWPMHVTKNFWCKVPEGLTEALDSLRAHGVHVAVVSNSEGMLDGLFLELGIRQSFDLIVDSGKVGVEKPDPRIFRIAMDQFGVSPAHAIHLGDVFATDIVGARAAGIRHALIDPYGHYENRHTEVPRVSGAVEVARAIVARKAVG